MPLQRRIDNDLLPGGVNCWAGGSGADNTALGEVLARADNDQRHGLSVHHGT
jgi:hypothetical protein